MENNYLTVTEITSYISKKIKMDVNLKNIYIKGEISNYKTYSSGHSYFTLKDKNSQIRAILFKGNRRFLKFNPENGMNVIVKGKIEVYVKNGYYQLIATKITEDGIGELHIAFEQLKKKLEKEGLFEKYHKKEIPKYPKVIGVITAETGAAIRDIITTIKRRYPICKIQIFPTRVQGDAAAPQLVKQIKHSQNYDLDTLIIGRGGGNIEDLWPFNEEIVVREIFNCKIPIISAIGHETDYTLSDFVSDLRAPTPTAAAELAAPKLSEVKNKINQLNKHINNNINNKITENKNKIKNISEKQILKNPESIYEIKEMHLDHMINKLVCSSTNIINSNKQKLHNLENSFILNNPDTFYTTKEIHLNNLINKLNYSSQNIIKSNQQKLNSLKKSYILNNPNKIIEMKKAAYLMNLEKLEILNPLLTLKRGYSIVKIDDKVITSAKDAEVGDIVKIEFKDGNINTKVI